MFLAQDFGIKKDQKDLVIGSVLLKKNGANFTSKNGSQIIEEMGGVSYLSYTYMKLIIEFGKICSF